MERMYCGSMYGSLFVVRIFCGSEKLASLLLLLESKRNKSCTNTYDFVCLTKHPYNIMKYMCFCTG